MNTNYILSSFFDRGTLLVLELYIVILFFLSYTLISAIKKLSKTVENRRFLFFIASITASIFFDMFCYFFDEKGNASTRIFNSISNTIYISLSIVLSYFWFAFVISKLEYEISKNKKVLSIFWIIILVHILITFTSNWTGFMFTIDENGVYQRGKLFFLQLVPWLFSVSATILTIIRMFDSKYFANRRFHISIILFTFFPIVCEIFQLFGAGSPSISIGYALGALFMYIILLEDNISSDGLTALNNRSYLIKFLTEKIRKLKKSDETYFFMFDINDFKMINDTYGHIEGDKALTVFSNSLKQVEMEYPGYIARYGGDEFTIVCDDMSVEKADLLINRLSTLLANASKENNLKYVLTISSGYTKIYTSDINNINKMIDRADGIMYLNKNNYKEEKKNKKK